VGREVVRVAPAPRGLRARAPRGLAGRHRARALTSPDTSVGNEPATTDAARALPEHPPMLYASPTSGGPLLASRAGSNLKSGEAARRLRRRGSLDCLVEVDPSGSTNSLHLKRRSTPYTTPQTASRPPDTSSLAFPCVRGWAGLASSCRSVSSRARLERARDAPPLPLTLRLTICHRHARVSGSGQAARAFVSLGAKPSSPRTREGCTRLNAYSFTGSSTCRKRGVPDACAPLASVAVRQASSDRGSNGWELLGSDPSLTPTAPASHRGPDSGLVFVPPRRHRACSPSALRRAQGRPELRRGATRDFRGSLRANPRELGGFDDDV
jgi:hypothetical protein